MKISRIAALFNHGGGFDDQNIHGTYSQSGQALDNRFFEISSPQRGIGFDDSVDNPHITGRELGKSLCDTAYEYFDNKRLFTLSVIDLEEMNSLYYSINAFASKAYLEIISNNSQSQYYNGAAKDSFGMYAMYLSIEHYYRDLGDFMEKIRSTPEIGSEVKEAAAQVQSSISRAVVYKTQSGYKNPTGLTIFHNI